MTTQNVDSDQKPNGTLDQPNPDVSKGEGVKPDSQVTEALKGLTERLEAIEKQQRSLQGDKDRAVNRNQSEIQKILEEVEALKGTGMTQQQAVSQIELKNTLQEMQQTIASLTSGAGNAGQQSGSPITKVIEEAGLSTEDADVSALLARSNVTEADVWKLAAKKAASPKPTEAQRLSSVSGESGKVDEDALSLEYERLSKNPTQNEKRMKEIEEVLWK